MALNGLVSSGSGLGPFEGSWNHGIVLPGSVKR
jgi:hypothetical protein